MPPSLQPYVQRLEYHTFDSSALAADLGVAPPPFSRPDALRQLNYLGWYLADPEVDCQSFLVEEPYIDRDHMEDHAVFYSRTLYPYPNYCRRVHFFRLPREQVESEISALFDAAHQKEQESFRQDCREFSRRAYLGFAVLKPLPGSPVGRTVLAHFPPEKPENPSYRRVFKCTREYVAHVAGVELFVEGLPFQQQDKAVAACATTAVWTALHRAREFEDIASFTPAQITVLASQRSLPFGRGMPSEGLSIDQMCQAVQGVGISPVLRSAGDFANARGLLYSSIRSGVAPVLAVTQGRKGHAVAAVGMGLREGAGELQSGVRDVAGELEALYIHDDRIGPYLRATIVADGSELRLDITVRSEEGLRTDSWYLKYILFPMHGKVRITFSELRELAFYFVATEVLAYVRSQVLSPVDRALVAGAQLDVATWIDRSYRYVGDLLESASVWDQSVALLLAREVSLPRYVGIVRLTAEYLDPTDVIIDTTSTDRNVHAAAVVPGAFAKPLTRIIAGHLASEFECRLVAP